MFQEMQVAGVGGGSKLTTKVMGSAFLTTGAEQTITVSGISKIHIVVMWQTQDSDPWYVFAIDDVNGSLYNDVRKKDNTLSNIGVQSITGNSFKFIWSSSSKEFNYYVIGE